MLVASQNKDRLKDEEVNGEERKARMLLKNPKFILRNYLAQLTIEEHITNPQTFTDLYQVLTHPYDEWEEFSEWSKPAPVKYKNLEVSCSS